MSFAELELSSNTKTEGLFAAIPAARTMGTNDMLLRNGGGSSTASDVSDLSAMENETDDLGKKILQHQRDQQRLKNVLNNSSRLFVKKPPALEDANGIRRRRLSPGLSPEPRPRTGSGESSNDSDPPLNVPKAWGRKDRRHSDWTRNYGHDAPSADSDDVASRREDEDAIIPRRTQYTGDDHPSFERRAVSDQPLDSIETTPPFTRRRRTDVTPTSLHHMNSTLPWTAEDDADFTSNSFLASTPMVNNRRRRIDELTRREIETLERAGVTKRELGKLAENSASSTAAPPPPTTTPFDTWPKHETPQPETDSGSKNHETNDVLNHQSKPVHSKNMHSGFHQRQDSYNLLRKLARVSSSSPSPARDLVRPAPVASQDENEASITSKDQIKREDQVEKTIARDTVKHMEPGSKETELPKLKRLSNREVLPQSALADVLAQAKDKHDGFLGDATVDSLNDIINGKSEGINYESCKSDRSKITDEVEGRLNDDLTPVERAQRQKDLAFEARRKRLRLLTNRKAESKKDKELNSLQEKPQDAPELLSETTRTLKWLDTVSSQSETDETPSPTITYRAGRCTHCGAPQGSLWGTLFLEFLSCFYRVEKKRIHLTWLGTIVVLWFTWLITESVLCEIYCQPQFAAWMQGYGVDPDAPEFPFVIPTLLFRPVRWAWQPAWELLAWCSGVWFNLVFGEGAHSSLPYSGKPPPSRRSIKPTSTFTRWMAMGTASTAKAVQSAIEAVDEVGSMWDDEYIT